MTPSPATNIASHLADMAGQQPWRQAVIFPQGRDSAGRASYTHLTFRQLDDTSNQLARGFERLGLRRGMRAALLAPPSLDFFALTFALFKLGAVLVLIDPGIGVRNLGRCLAEAEPAAFIGIPKAQAARVVLGWARKTVSIKVTVGARALLGGHSLDQVRRLAPEREPYPLALPQPDETAAILFTSGSTGPPKGVVYTHAIFNRQVELIRLLYGIKPGEIDLPTFPLFSLFGPALGMTAVIPEMDPTRPAQVDPVKIIEAIENFGITNMFGSPALINRVGRYGEPRGIKLPTLRRVISAGAPVPAPVLQRFVALLSPGVQVFTPYGATECLPASSIGSGEILGETRRQTDQGKGVCVGRPAPGLNLRIIRITDEPIAAWSDSLLAQPGEIGEIVVQGPQVTLSYFNRPDATALAKIPDAGGLYHRMGDVGCVDQWGRVWFCGRKSHRVATRHGILFTIPCEAIFNTLPGVYRTALVGVPRGGDSEPVICVELEPGCPQPSREELRRQLKALGAKYAHTQAIKTFLFHPRFPVDIRHNAKIFREKLAAWASRQLS